MEEADPLVEDCETEVDCDDVEPVLDPDWVAVDCEAEEDGVAVETPVETDADVDPVPLVLDCDCVVPVWLEGAVTVDWVD